MFDEISVRYIEPGLYQAGTNYETTSYSWSKLTNSKTIKIKSENDITTVYTRFDSKNATNESSKYLNGDLVLKSGIYVVGIDGFRYCLELKSVNMKSIQIIKTNGFQNCKKLEKVILSKHIHTIEENAFADCISLKEIYYEGTFEEFQKINFGKQKITQEVTVICSDKTQKIKF
jgi:hypothetical protein